MDHRILVTGATGNLGSKVADLLAAKGGPLRVTGRKEEALSRFSRQAETMAGDLEDPDRLPLLLEGVKAVFLVLPHLTRTNVDEFAARFLNVAEAQGVTHMVNISNCTLSRWGKPTPLIEFEAALGLTSRIHILHLRCANFFENLNWGIHTPYRGNIRLPYISSNEIACVAAARLQRCDFRGISVEELMGSADYSMEDFAQKLGVAYRQLPTPPELAPFFDAFNSGQYQLVQRTAANTSQRKEPEFTLDYFLEHHFNKALLV